ncbi:hypothetical protein F2Q69_00021175 [Brassica cretica]|uniref:3-isopropylmalate dehydrogenase n=1 Tax=Brassica cretica TaxID=69181 RepID=A0A8S9Q379_BRACR|nr:hypothetical protein F2Q69_00021175 [Brassica cretica]
MAMERRGKVCSVDKATILESSRLWRKRVTIMSEEYPEVDLSHMLVDTSGMELIRYPKQFDVLLTTNVFGDILSDVSAMTTGGIGMLPSACIGGPGPQLFEPVHGSAPDIEGEDVANPLAAVLTAVMLLRYGLKEEAVAKRIENAIFDTLNEGFRTRDIPTPGAKIVGCKKMGEEILKSLYVRVPSVDSIPLVEYSGSNVAWIKRRGYCFYPNDQTQFVISTDHVHSSDFDAIRYGLKEENAAQRIEKAVSDVLDRGFRTRDIHTPGTTLVGCKRMGEEILRSLDARVSV